MYQDINNAIEYIELHLYEEVLLEDIAKYVNYSRTHLSRKFNKYLGVSLREYIAKRRLSNAAMMIYETDKPIQYIADLHGFKSAKYFSTLFKNELGITPREYRTKRSFLYIYPKRLLTDNAKVSMNNLEEVVVTANLSVDNHRLIQVSLDNKKIENNQTIIKGLKHNSEDKDISMKLTIPVE